MGRYYSFITGLNKEIDQSANCQEWTPVKKYFKSTDRNFLI